VPPEFPPRPSKRTGIALAAVALLTFLYSIIVAGQILLWFVLAGIAVGLYLTYLLVVVLFRLVEAVERIATAAEVDSGIGDASDVDPPTADRGVGDFGVGIERDAEASEDPADTDETEDSAAQPGADDADPAPGSGSDADSDRN
jgi:hypothetical protein